MPKLRSKFPAVLVCALFILAIGALVVIGYSQSISLTGAGINKAGLEGVDLFNLQRERLGRQAAINRFNAAVALEKVRRAKTLTTSRPGATTTFATTLASSQWKLIGPQPAEYFGASHVSGRATAIAVDPTNPSIAYLGAAEGGVWKTTDGGQHWTPLTDNQPSLAIGSIAVAPSDPNVIYAGTGEEDGAIDAYFGAGILKSTDGGSSWVNIPGSFVGSRIGTIAVNPQNSSDVLIGVLASSLSNDGVQLSTDGGMTWTPVLAGSPATAVKFDPTNGSIAYAVLSSAGLPAGSPNGLYKSTDGGQTWTAYNGQGGNVLPTSTPWGLTSLAISPSSPSTMYIGPPLFESGSYTPTVYKTVDGGMNWTQLSSAPDYCGQQCWYDNVVAVAPNNPNVVLLGGEIPPLYLSLDGGPTWSSISTDSSGNSIHPDMHAIAFSSDGSEMYIGNDGGIWSTSLGSTGVGNWTDLNDTLAITQFYPGQSINPVNPLVAFGGTQDNGVVRYSGTLTWQTVACGDGYSTAIDFLNPSTIYVDCSDGFFKSTSNGDPGTWSSVQPQTQASPSLSVAAPGGFTEPLLVMDPTNPAILYHPLQCGVSGECVAQTIDGGNSWAVISPNLLPITAIAVSPSDPNTVYVAQQNPTSQAVWVTTDASAGQSSVWNQVGSLPGVAFVNAIAVDPSNGLVAYAAMGNPFAGERVLKTTDGGASWTEIGSGLPSVAVNDVLIDPDVPDTLYVATDVGVFYTSDGGTTWSPLMNGLPEVAVMDLKLYRPTRLLRVGTHGRSMWELQLPSVPSPVSVSPSGLTFANTMVGSASASQVVTLNNGGTGPLTIYSITTGADFNETNKCSTTLLGGASCTINVSFAPTTTGTLSEELTITDDAPGSPQTVTLSGTGTPPAVTLSTYALTFSNQALNTTSAPQTVTLTNSGASSLTISGITTTGDFAETNSCPGSLAASASCTISVTFTPTALGQRTGTVSISDSAPGSPQMVSLLGTGAEPAVTLSASALTFASENVGTSGAAQMETITNTGNASLTFNSISMLGSNPGDFAIAPSGTTCSTSATVAPNGSCAIQVVFSPTVAGNRSASLSITDNAPGSPQTVSLSGSGMDFSIAVSSGSPSSMTVTAGGAASDSLTLTPEGGFNQAVSLACSSVPSKATCTVSPASVTTDGTNPVQVNVNVTTTAASLAAPRVPSQPTTPPLALWIMIFGLVGLAFVHLKTRSVRVRMAVLAPLALLLMSVALWTSCGGGGGGGGGGGNTNTTPGTPAGTYTLTVTGTSGSLQHSTTVTLVVK